MMLSYIHAVHRLNVLHQASPTWCGISMPLRAVAPHASADINAQPSRQQRNLSRKKTPAPPPPTTPTDSPKKKKKKKKKSKKRAAPIITYSPAELAERGVATAPPQPRAPLSKTDDNERPTAVANAPVQPPVPSLHTSFAAVENPPKCVTTTRALPDTLAALGIPQTATLARLAHSNATTSADVEAVASLLQAHGLGLQPLRPLLIVRPSLLLGEELTACGAQLAGISSVLSAPSSAPTKAATAALRAMMRHDLQHGWRSLPTPNQLHSILCTLQESLGISTHRAAKLGAANPTVLMQSASKLQRHITALVATTGASIPVLRRAVQQAPDLLVMEDAAVRVARLQSMLAARCDLSPAAVLEQVIATAPQVLTLTAPAAGGTAGVLARALGAAGAGRLLSLAPTVLCMPVELLRARSQLLAAQGLPLSAAVEAPVLLTGSRQRVGPRLAFLRAKQPSLLQGDPGVLQQCLQCGDIEFVEGFAEGLLEEYVVFQVQWSSMNSAATVSTARRPTLFA